MARKSFKIRGNLVEALDETISSAKNNAGNLHIEIIPLKKIELDPENPRDFMVTIRDLNEGISKNDQNIKRKQSEKESLNSLMESIKGQGIINPIVVYKHHECYRLIAGERRTLASILANKSDIPAKILNAKPEPLKLSLIQWIENIEREDLSLWERIRNLEKILTAYAKDQEKESPKVTPTELSKLLACSLQQGVNYRHVLNASTEIMKHIKEGSIKNIEKAAFISKSPAKLQKSLTQACLKGATLTELKKIAMGTSVGKNFSSSQEGGGKINFGTTKSTKAAKTIIDTIVNHNNFQHLGAKLGDVVWSDPKSIAVAFRKLVKLLECI